MHINAGIFFMTKPPIVDTEYAVGCSLCTDNKRNVLSQCDCFSFKLTFVFLLSSFMSKEVHFR